MEEQDLKKFKRKRAEILLKLTGFSFIQESNSYEKNEDLQLGDLRLVGILLGIYNNDKSLLKDKDVMEKDIRRYEKIESYIDKKEEELSNRRWFHEDFGKNMKNKLPKEKWDLYIKQVQKVRNLIELMEKNDFDDSKIADEISNCIDEAEFDSACKIENDFYISELNGLTSKIDEFCLDCTEEQKKNNSVYNTISRIKNRAINEIKTRRKQNDKIVFWNERRKATKVILKNSGDFEPEK